MMQVTLLPLTVVPPATGDFLRQSYHEQQNTMNLTLDVALYRNSLFSSSKFSSKKYSHKIIFIQTKLDENNLQVACGEH